jgi:hypothetical protein
MAPMKMLTARVVRGQLDLPEGLLEEGSTVTVLIPETEEGFDLSEGEVAFIRESMDQIARGDWVDGQQLLDEIRPLPPIELNLSQASPSTTWRREEIYGDNGR